MVKHIGLTGGIASGKSAVAARLASRGAVIIDADLLAREVVEPGTAGLKAVVARFGADIVSADGSLDRAALGRRVFGDAQARADLEAIIHPAVRARAAELAAAAPNDSVVVQVIPLLVEVGLADGFDLVVVVDVDPAVQRQRLAARDGYGPAEIDARIGAQASRRARLAQADVVIGNNGSMEELNASVDRFWRQYAAGESSGISAAVAEAP